MDATLEIRSAGPTLDVDYPERTVELIVVPYEETARVEYHGRMIEEVVAAGSFDGIERRANRVRVNYHHQDSDIRHLLGRAVSFYPNRPEGLVAKLRIVAGEAGDLALNGAADGLLGASAGFRVMQGGESWPTRSMRRLTKLFLDHVALTPDSAYQGAQVLAVRARTEPGERPATPLLDQVRADILRERYDSLRR